MNKTDRKINCVFHKLSMLFTYFGFWMLALFHHCCTRDSGFHGRPEAAGKFETVLEYAKFIDPPPEFRPYPFFSVNDKLNPEEIARQVKEFGKAGFGGFYLHSREGLLTGYLGEEWWQAMDAAADAAEESCIHACFYDEDKWPSGYAGGKIPLMNADYRAKCLVRIKKGTPLPSGSEMIKDGDSVLYIAYTAKLGNPLFNGTCYVDLFNRDVVSAFIGESYKPYIDRYLTRMGRFEIFTDEPHIHARYFDRNTPHEGSLSWSPFLAEKFRQMWGYDLACKIELLFEERENWREVRLQYYIAVASQFEDSFTKQIAKYCGKRGVKSSGHYLGEESLEKVRDRIGNAMLHYRNMQKPGIDNLGLTTTGRLITAKSLSSVANQYDIPERLCEIYGISGQNLNFEDRKWLSGWQVVLGVNRMVPHLALYSLKGTRKRDYPPTISFHQPWWPFNKKIADYTGRISYAATVGRFKPQILVINPLESEYIKSKKEPGFSNDVHALMEELQKSHYDYDLGDEQILAELACIRKGGVEVGVMRYDALILPDMAEIRRTTVELISRFIREGGAVFSLGRFPQYLDGRDEKTKLDDLEEKIMKLDPENIAQMLAEKIKPQVNIKGDGSHKIWSCVREVDDGALILLCNTSHTETIRFSLQSELAGYNPVLWDPASARCYTTETDAKGQLELLVSPSSLIWLTSGSLSNDARISGKFTLPEECDESRQLDMEWTGKRLSPNAITLDFASWSNDGGLTYSQSEPVIAIFQRLSDIRYEGALSLLYRVKVEDIPESARLAVEQPGIYSTLTVNGHTTDFNGPGYFIDPGFITADIKEYLQKGENSIRLDLNFRPAIPESPDQQARYGTEIESIFITGDFAVNGYGEKTTFSSQRNDSPDMVKKPVHRYHSFGIGSEKPKLKGNLTTEGYPFFAGAFELSGTFQAEKEPGCRYFLNLPLTESVVTIVELNGVVTDTLVWLPSSSDVTTILVTGENKIRLTFYSSLRNLLGPHHHPKGELIRVGPDSFTGSGGFPEPSGDRNWYDLRKTNPELKLWTDEWNFIPFGLLEKPELLVFHIKE